MAPVSAVLASIPSPPTGVYHVGPLTIHMYGVMLLLAIAARALADRRPLGALRRRLGSRLPRRGLGRRSPGSSARGSTTRSRAGTRTRATRAGTGRSPSGRAASASGAGSCFGVLVGAVDRAALRRRASACSWTRSRRASCSRRRSAAGATSGTRSSTASTRRCRGASRSTARRAANTLPPDLPLRVHLGHPRRRRPALGRPPLHAPAARRSSRSTSPGTRPSARSRSCCASTRRTTSSAQRLNFWVSLVCFVVERRVLRLVAVPARAAARRARRRRRPARRGEVPKGPTMAVPRGRVR